MVKEKAENKEKTQETQSVDEDVCVEKTDHKKMADDIIRKRVYAALGAGFVPIPVFDVLALSGIQIEMVARLSKLYEIPFKKDIVKTAISALVGGTLPVAATPIIASVVKLIPVIGYTTSAVTMSITGGASTYAVGKVFVQHFESGGTLLNFNADKVKAYYNEKFKEGENLASKAKAN